MAEYDEGSVFWRLTVKTDDADKKLKGLSKTVSNLNTLFGLFKVSAFVKGLASITDLLGKWTQEQAKLIQTQSVFNKTMGESIEKAKEFRDAMQSRLGIDPQDVMTSMTMFTRLTETFGLSSDAAYIMSKNLTQLAADYTAYGYTFSEVTTKLRSGISGEIKGMRQLGVALDEATLQETLYGLGIDRRVDSLTRAQKTELLYYQIMTQTSKVQGELGRTMITPANATRILKQEFTQLGRAIGSIFIPLAMKIVPVVRAVVQILTEAAKAIAKFFGFNIGDYTSNYSDGLIDISDGLDDIADSAGSATKAMNKMLMPFDELNNINFNSGSGSGAGASGLAGSLFNAEDLPQYDIFESIFGNIDEEVEKIKRKINDLLPIFATLGGAIAAAFAISKLVEFLSWADKVHTALSNLGAFGGVLEIGLGTILAIGGIWAQYQGTKKLLNGDYSIWAILETIGGTAVGAFGIATILRGIGTIGGFKVNFGEALKFGLGIMLAIQAIQVALDGVQNKDIFKMLLGALEGGFAGMTLASSLGASRKGSLKFGFGLMAFITGIELSIDAKTQEEWYTALGESLLGSVSTGAGVSMMTGNPLIGTLAAAGNFAATWAPSWEEIGDTFSYLFGGEVVKDLRIWMGIQTEATENQKQLTTETERYVNVLEAQNAFLNGAKQIIKDLAAEYDNRIKSINETKEATLLNLDVSKEYANQLNELTDSEGKVTAANKDRASFIIDQLNSALGLELQLGDDLVIRNGETEQSYDEIVNSINETIEAKKRDAEQTAKLQIYQEATNKKVAMEYEMRNAAKEYSEALEQYRQVDKRDLAENTQLYIDWERTLGSKYAIMIASAEGYQEAIEEMQNASDFAFGEMEKPVEDYQIDIQEMADISNETFDEISENVKQNMGDAANAIDTSTIPEKVDTMATKSKNKWNTLFDLDNITKQKVKNAVKEIDSSALPNVAENIAKKSSNKFNVALDWINIAKNKLKDTANAIDSNSGVVVTATQGVTNQVYAAAQVDTTWIGQNVVYGLAEGIDEASMGYRLSSSLGNLANRLVNKLSNLFGIHSPSTVMRDEIGYFLPLGIAEGIDDGAYAVENSIQDLVNKTRVDMQAFDFYTGADLVSSVNGSISAKTSAALSESTLDSMANATYEGMARALTENNDDYNPQFNVYVGNDKVYSGYANYQNNESNRYGVKV